MQHKILEEVEKLLCPMALAQRYLEGQKYATVSLIPYSLWKIRNALSSMKDSQNITPSAKYIAGILYDDFCDKHYGDGNKVFYDEVSIGRMNRYISLDPVVLLATALDPRMKTLSPFIPNCDHWSIWDKLSKVLVEFFKSIPHNAQHPRGNQNETEIELGDETIENVDLCEDAIFFADLNAAQSDTAPEIDDTNGIKECCQAEIN